MLKTLYSYHHKLVLKLVNKTENEYWDRSKLVSVGAMTELVFREGPALPEDILDIVPNVFAGVSFLDSKTSVKQIQIHFHKRQNYSTTFDIFDPPIAELAIHYSFNDNAYTSYPSIPITLVVLCCLSGKYNPDFLSKDTFDNYKDEIHIEFRKNNPYMRNVKHLLIDFCWDNYYRYICCFDVLPMELRVLIAGFM
jgi:hypothetical protein